MRRNYVATQANCEPLLTPAVKYWGPLKRQMLYSHPSHLWATADFLSPSEVVGNP